MREKAIVLLSGGMDSAVAFYSAMTEHDCIGLIVDYGQKARKELDLAKKLCDINNVKYHTLTISLPWGGSSLLNPDDNIPKGDISSGEEIPSTYVPARNIIFLSFALSMAEAEGASAIYIGAHQVDYSNYPDCRDEFFEAYKDVANKGTKTGISGNAVRIETPLLRMTKSDIIKRGCELGVPFEYTWSCYEDGPAPCGECESCVLRAKGFDEAGVEDRFEQS